LDESAELRRELARLRECIAAHQDDTGANSPPSGLAERTASRVVDCAESDGARVGGHYDGFAPVGDPPAGILGWSLADLSVAGGVMLAVSMLIFPALRNSRDGTRQQVCQHNQSQLWVLINNYAQDHGGLYPQVGPNENAGMYVARLIAKGYVRPEDIRVLLVCPGAPLADKIRSGEWTINLPNAASLRAMTARQLFEVTAGMSPFYSYRFPYRIGREYYYIRDERRPLSPVFSDTSSDEPGYAVSPNHGGKIVQVQFGDGSLRVLTSRTLPGGADDMFRNDLGMVAAGVNRLDAVLGRSDAMPGVEFAAGSR
jgi:hypothetical protein